MYKSLTITYIIIMSVKTEMNENKKIYFKKVDLNDFLCTQTNIFKLV